MKIVCLLLFTITVTSAWAQSDSVSKVNIEPINIEPVIGEITYGSLYPMDSLTYDQYLGEYISGSSLAEGWRRDTLNGGLNKTIYSNSPYLSGIHFYKEDLGRHSESFVAYRYDAGMLFTGRIIDTFTVSFKPNKIAGYFNGKPYYETVELTAIFRADCVNGVIEGRAVLCGRTPQFGIYDNLLLAECYFEKGEMIGECLNYDLNSVDVTISDGDIRTNFEIYDYIEFKEMLEVESLVYEKGNSQAKELKKKNKATKKAD